jgi:hypothetical protein
MAQVRNISMIPNDSLARVGVSQYDVGRTLQFRLFDGSTDYVVPVGATVKVQATKPSGLGFNESCTVSGSTVTVVTTEGMTDEWGNIETEVVIFNGDDRIGSANFVLAVEKSPHPTGTTDGSAEVIIPELTLLVQRAESAAGVAIAAKESAEEYAGHASTSAENAAGSATEAGQSKLDAAGFAQDAGGFAQTSEAYAKGTRGGADVPSTDPTYHNNSKYYADQSAGSASDADQAKRDAVSAKESAQAAAQTAATDAAAAAHAAVEAQVENAEAWARGTKDGTDVPSTDPTYHNNSKYYADQAADTAAAMGQFVFVGEDGNLYYHEED